MLISETILRSIIKSIVVESLNLEDSRSIQDTIRILNNESQALKDELANKGSRAKTFFNFQISDRLDNAIGSFQSEYEFLDTVILEFGLFSQGLNRFLFHQRNITRNHATYTN